ncbi:MAG: hypothetical protein ACHP7J_00010 [Terriglobales bacterium]
MHNEFLTLLLPGCPATILGVVVGDGRYAAKVKFGNGSDMKACASWVRDKFMRWAKCQEEQVAEAVDGINFTVEVVVK